MGFSQEAQQQDLEPQPGIDAVAQLLLAALELGLPKQQSRFADTAGQLRKLGPELGGEAGELEAVGGGAGQHQVPQQTGQTLEHGGGLPAPLQQAAAGLE